MAQIKVYEDEKLKKDKAITCLHSRLTDHIFTKTMDLETPKQVGDNIQDEFEGSNRVKSIRLLTSKREFELMKMKDNEFVKDYSGRLMDVGNQMRPLGEVPFTNQKVAENIMVLVPEKFEANISIIKKSCDLQTLIVTQITASFMHKSKESQQKVIKQLKVPFQQNTMP